MYSSSKVMITATALRDPYFSTLHSVSYPRYGMWISTLSFLHTNTKSSELRSGTTPSIRHPAQQQLKNSDKLWQYVTLSSWAFCWFSWCILSDRTICSCKSVCSFWNLLFRISLSFIFLSLVIWISNKVGVIILIYRGTKLLHKLITAAYSRRHHGQNKTYFFTYHTICDMECG